MQQAKFTTTIKKFDEQGEKTGWTYIEIPAGIAQQLMPGNKKSFRVKGCLDTYTFHGIALLPMGNGGFIMALNAAIRKAIRKNKGAMLQVQMQVDTNPVKPPAELIECLQDEPVALQHFYGLPKSYQNYFTRWIESAKTQATKTKRIALAVSAMHKGIDFGSMIRSIKNDRKDALNKPQP